MKLVWAERARRDLADIAEYIARDNLEAAWAWVERLERRAESLLAAPLANRMVPELERTDIREAIVGNYRLVYRAEKERIVVLTVFEGHRLLDNALPSADDDS